MKKVYLLSIEDIDENLNYYILTKEWYDWIFSNIEEPLESMVDALFNNKSEMEFQGLSTKEDAKEFIIIETEGDDIDGRANIFKHFVSIIPNPNRLKTYLSKNKLEVIDEIEIYEC